MTSPLVRSLALMAALLAGSLTRAAEPAANDKEPAKVFVGYLFTQPRDINYKLYTHICHAFLTADGDGKLQQRRNVPNKDLTRDAHAAGVKVLVSLGGWGWDKQFASLVSKPESEDLYVTSVMKVVDEGDYDGIDLDWEYPDTADEVVGFERLTRRFRKLVDALGKTKGRPMFITMAASSNAGTLRWLKTEFLVENMDWVNVMTYDFTGAWTNYAGHHSPLHASSRDPGRSGRSSEATIKYLLEERKMPANRLALGIPLYGRGFAVPAPYASTKGATKKRVPGGNYNNLHKLQREEGWVRTWDDETKNPWLTSPDKSMVIGYDDAESVALKTEWAMKKGLRGVFFWQIAADRLPDGTNPLQEASHKAWEQGAQAAK